MFIVCAAIASTSLSPANSKVETQRQRKTKADENFIAINSAAEDWRFGRGKIHDVHNIDNGCLLCISFALLFKYFPFNLLYYYESRLLSSCCCPFFNCKKKDYNASKNTD